MNTIGYKWGKIWTINRGPWIVSTKTLDNGNQMSCTLSSLLKHEIEGIKCHVNQIWAVKRNIIASVNFMPLNKIAF